MSKPNIQYRIYRNDPPQYTDIYVGPAQQVNDRHGRIDLVSQWGTLEAVAQINIRVKPDTEARILSMYPELPIINLFKVNPHRRLLAKLADADKYGTVAKVK